LVGLGQGIKRRSIDYEADALTTKNRSIGGGHKIYIIKGPSHKRRSHKIDPPSYPCPCGHTINLEKSEVFVPKNADVRRWRTSLVRTEQTHLPCGRLLWTASIL